MIKKTVPFEEIQILQKEDIAAMKIHAIEDRGAKRDFFDLYFLAKEFTLEKMLKFYDQKYGTLKEHFYMIELIDPAFDVRVYFSNPPLNIQLGIL